MTHAEYAEKLLNPDVIPTSMGMRTPLLFALNLVLRRRLVIGFAEELQEQCFSLPRITTHAGRQQASGIAVVILSEHRMATLIANARRRCLQESECTPLLAAFQVNLAYLSITTSDARLLTNFTPQIARIITQILRMHTFREVKGFLAALTEAVVLLGKQEWRISQRINTNAFRRQHHLDRFCSIHSIRTIIDHSTTPIPLATTPFTIPIVWIREKWHCLLEKGIISEEQYKELQGNILGDIRKFIQFKQALQ